MQTGVVSAPDRLTGTAAENKLIFDRLIRAIVAQCLNPLIEELTGKNGMDSIGSPWDVSLLELMRLAKSHWESRENPHGIDVLQIGAETPEGAQARVDAALAAANGNLSAHTANRRNPHEVTVAQIGAETPDGAQAKADAVLAAAGRNLSAHTANKKNPHEVTVAQIGAETPDGAQARADAALAAAGRNLSAHMENKRNPHEVTTALIGAETPAGAQARVNAAMSDHIKDRAAHHDALYSVVEEAVQTFSNRTYTGTLFLTIPAGGWVADSGGNQERAYFCNVPAKVSADIMPEGACIPGSFKTAQKARVAPSCQCFDGYIQFYAESPPGADIQAWISLYRAWDGDTQVEGIPVGEGLELTPEGRLAVKAGNGLELDENGALSLNRNEILSQDDFVNEDEMLASIEEIFGSGGEDPLTKKMKVSAADISDLSENEIADLFAD